MQPIGATYPFGRTGKLHGTEPSSAPNNTSGNNSGASASGRGLQRGTLTSSSSSASPMSAFSFAASGSSANIGKRQLVRRSAMSTSNGGNGGGGNGGSSGSDMRHRPSSQGSARSSTHSSYQSARAHWQWTRGAVGNSCGLVRPYNGTRSGASASERIHPKGPLTIVLMAYTRALGKMCPIVMPAGP